MTESFQMVNKLNRLTETLWIGVPTVQIFLAEQEILEYKASAEFVEDIFREEIHLRSVGHQGHRIFGF